LWKKERRGGKFPPVMSFIRFPGAVDGTIKSGGGVVVVVVGGEEKKNWPFRPLPSPKLQARRGEAASQMTKNTSAEQLLRDHDHVSQRNTFDCDPFSPSLFSPPCPTRRRQPFRPRGSTPFPPVASPLLLSPTRARASMRTFAQEGQGRAGVCERKVFVRFSLAPPSEIFRLFLSPRSTLYASGFARASGSSAAANFSQFPLLRNCEEGRRGEANFSLLSPKATRSHKSMGRQGGKKSSRRFLLPSSCFQYIKFGYCWKRGKCCHPSVILQMSIQSRSSPLPPLPHPQMLSRAIFSQLFCRRLSPGGI